ncbi:MAG: ATP-binding protein [Bacteroidales bacterium]|nr:ATP-binding protein [Bacteroidales bacterium]
MKRQITKILKVWKNSKIRKPLILRGARQVGKTYTIKEFGKSYFTHSHFVDLERNPELIELFAKNRDPFRILSELELFLKKEIIPGKDLLFIDEIQVSKDALASLRYFYEEIPELHLIAAGSLLEFGLKDISFPVGRVETLTMFPMNFYEFLTANGSDFLLKKLGIFPDSQSESFHLILLEELKKYMLIGGMPEVVKTYIKNGSYLDAIHIQKELLETFIQDFTKFAGRADKACLFEVMHNVAKHVGKQSHYSKLAEGFTGPTIKNAYQLLKDARIITKIPAIDPSGIPLGGSASGKKFKTIFLDIGLMNSICGLSEKKYLLTNDIMSLYKGQLAEQFVGQELLSNASANLYYWSRDTRGSNAEVDYVISKGTDIIPIEVKSSASGHLKSLHFMLEKYKNIKNGYVLSTANYSTLKEQKLTFLPIYMAKKLMDLI